VSKLISAPVGIRFKVHNVANFQKDQQTVSDLLFKIPLQYGGKGPTRAGETGPWLVAVPGGPNKVCRKEIADAILDFQVHWKNKGVFHNIDGVADPDGNTIKLMEKLAGAPSHPLDPIPKPGMPVIPETPETPKPKVILTNPRVGGSWQITSVTSFAVGELYQVGGIKMEITQPEGKKFEIGAVAGGIGASTDPAAIAKWLKNIPGLASPAVLQGLKLMEARGVGLNIGDYLQWFGLPLSQVTQGRIIGNPIFAFPGAPAQPTRVALVGGTLPGFTVFSANLGAGMGVEGGIIGFGASGRLNPMIVNSSFIGCYGLGGATLKIGGALSTMFYEITSVTDL
jgi:hypothetical protein